MKKKQAKYYRSQRPCLVLMALALLWLTVSAPFVYSNQQKLARQDKVVKTCVPNTGNEEEAPIGNTTEEKIPADGNAAAEEYLHNQYKDDYFCAEMLRSHECENMRIYIAFHSEILVPPPNAA